MLQENAIADAGSDECSTMKQVHSSVFVAASAYLIALLIIHLLRPPLEPARIEQA